MTPGGSAGLGEQPGDRAAGARRLLRRLEHDRVAGDERRRGHAEPERDGEVERRDDAEDAVRTQHVACCARSARAARAASEAVRGPRRWRVRHDQVDRLLDLGDRLGAHLADLEADRRGELELALVDQPCSRRAEARGARRTGVAATRAAPGGAASTASPTSSAPRGRGSRCVRCATGPPARTLAGVDLTPATRCAERARLASRASRRAPPRTRVELGAARRRSCRSAACSRRYHLTPRRAGRSLVAALQTAGVPGDPTATLAEFERNVRALRATFEGLELVVAPELHLMALPPLLEEDGVSPRDLAVDVPGELTERLGALGARHPALADPRQRLRAGRRRRREHRDRPLPRR